MKAKIYFFLPLVLVILQVWSQPSVHYRLGLDNIRHHELLISVVFRDLPEDSLRIRMPNTSPGRYAIHQFAKNVYLEKAWGQAGQPLPITRITPFEWEVPTDSGYVRFDYVLYANHADGTYSGVDARKVHLNMPSAFVYGAGLADAPISLSVDLSQHPEWQVATQLQLNNGRYEAPNYSYFYDSPVMVGKMDTRSWQVEGQTIEIAMMHEGTASELDAYAGWVKKVVVEEQEIYGSLPDFDYGRYTFLCSYNPWVKGDGMEHRNSTICTNQGSLMENADRLIRTISHEFFHAWNIERLRPATLEPFDFDNANLSGELWFGEGFTSYYDDLVLCRAGITAPEEYLASATNDLNYVLNFPGRDIRSPVEMSYNATFVDAATAIDETNFSNTFISYYSYGAVLGLVLDLSLRRQFKGITLDHYMRSLWEKYGRPERPYTMDDLQTTLAELTGEASFADEFFKKHIYGRELPALGPLFAEFGVEVNTARSGKVHFGNIQVDKNGVVQSPVQRGTPLYEAGVEQGDRILALAGMLVGEGDFRQLVDQLSVGEKYEIRFIQMGTEQTGYYVARQDPSIKLTLISGKELSRSQQARRSAWLGQD